jgi:hypothetical protein
MLHVMVLQAKIACDMTFQATLVKLYVVEDLSQPVERRLFQWSIQFNGGVKWQPLQVGHGQQTHEASSTPRTTEERKEKNSWTLGCHLARGARDPNLPLLENEATGHILL